MTPGGWVPRCSAAIRRGGCSSPGRPACSSRCFTTRAACRSISQRRTYITIWLLVDQILEDHAIAVDLFLRIVFELLDLVFGLRVSVLVLHLLY